jgi:hypothetical protein
MRLLSLLLVLATCTCALGQAGTFGDAKPRLVVTCPEEIVSVGQEFSVKADFGHVKSGKPEYLWSISQGIIVTGQGTPAIVVRPDIDGVTITASLEIGGGPFWFGRLEASCTTEVAALPVAKLIGRFDTENVGYVELMFDNLFTELWNDPSARGVVAISGPNISERRKLKRLAERQSARRKFDGSRITFHYDKKSAASLFQLWVVPVGAKQPE